MRKRIGLLDHLGSGNLGDDATFDTIKQNILDRIPPAEIVAFTMNPDYTHRHHDVAAYPLRRRNWSFGPQEPPSGSPAKEGLKTLLGKWRFVYGALRLAHTVAVRLPREVIGELLFLVSSFQRVRSLDVLLVSGGGQLLDWNGPWQFPYTIFKWVLLARLARVRVLFLNVGAGPVDHPLSRLFIRRALSRADYVSFRDERSQRLVNSIGYRRSSVVGPDCVYAFGRLPVEPGFRKEPGRASVGVAPMPFYDPRSVYPEKSQILYDDFIAALSSFCSWLAGNHHGVTLLGSDIGLDRSAIEDLRIRLGKPGMMPPDVPIQVPPVETTADLLRAMSSLDSMITCRFHGVVFAHLLSIPVIAISHHPKIDTLMGELGLSEYCIDIHAADCATLRQAFVSLQHNRERIRSGMAEKLAAYRKDLSAQFDEVIVNRICGVSAIA